MCNNAILNIDGTGMLGVKHYIDETTISTTQTDIPLEETDKTFELTWTMENDVITTNIIHLESYLDGDFYVERYCEFIYDFENETLTRMECDFWPMSKNDDIVYTREKPEIPYGYIMFESFYYKITNKEQSLIQNIKGLWHIDLVEWTYNEDKTGMIDIPSMGPYEGEIRNFSYTITEIENGKICIISEFDDGTTSFTWHEINLNEGSMMVESSGFEEPVKFTWQFDIGNCPWTKEIIENNLSVLTGSFFNDFLVDLIK